LAVTASSAVRAAADEEGSAEHAHALHASRFVTTFEMSALRAAGAHRPAWAARPFNPFVAVGGVQRRQHAADTRTRSLGLLASLPRFPFRTRVCCPLLRLRERHECPTARLLQPPAPSVHRARERVCARAIRQADQGWQQVKDTLTNSLLHTIAISYHIYNVYWNSDVTYSAAHTDLDQQPITLAHISMNSVSEQYIQRWISNHTTESRRRPAQAMPHELNRPHGPWCEQPPQHPPSTPASPRPCRLFSSHSANSFVFRSPTAFLPAAGCCRGRLPPWGGTSLAEEGAGRYCQRVSRRRAEGGRLAAVPSRVVLLALRSSRLGFCIVSCSRFLQLIRILQQQVAQSQQLHPLESVAAVLHACFAHAGLHSVYLPRQRALVGFEQIRGSHASRAPAPLFRFRVSAGVLARLRVSTSLLC
jgi:hypothetical protein